ncbi:MAG: hypothetical protein D6713_10565 [Deltaproteobacteria bacterium]|nr:MAG: hypothetical protein D6713_10565 [Deltaproteobacteria bacterium]
MRNLFRLFLLGIAFLSIVSIFSCGERTEMQVIETRREGKVLRVAASDEAIDFAREYFSSLPPELEIPVSYVETHSQPSVNFLKTGEADMAVVTRRVHFPEGEKSYIYVPVAYGGLVFVVDEGAGIEGLSSARIRDIYAGRVKNWKEVGGKDLPIFLIHRPPHSTARFLAGRLIGGFDERENEKAGVFIAETNGAAVELTRRLKGFIAYIVVNSPDSGNFRGRALRVDGLPPLMSNLPSGNYPVPVEIAFVVPSRHSGQVGALVDYAFSTEGIHRIAAIGLVPAGARAGISSCHCRAVDTVASPHGRVKRGVLTIGVVPEFTFTRQESRFAPLANLLSEKLRVSVRLKHYESYGRLVEEFRRGNLDGAFVGSFVYALLARNPGIVPVARPLTGGKGEYRGLLLVRRESPFSSFADLEGRSVSFVPRTTAGEVFMSLLLKRAGKSADGFFRETFPTLTHEDSLNSLLAGKVEGAFVKDLVFERIAKKHPLVKEKVRVLEASSPVPENALVLTREGFDAIGEEVRELLLNLHTSTEGRRVLSSLGAERFVPTSEEDYRNLYGMLREAGYGEGG